MIAKRLLAVVLTLALTVCPVFALSFPDVYEEDEYAEAVDYVSDIGLMIGDDLGNFNPNKSVTRAEMATIICRMADEADDLTTSDLFTDVPSNHWANGYVTRAYEMGVVNGYGNGNFGPADLVLYEQALAMVIRVLGAEEDAQFAGGYPDGYIISAENVGLLRNLNAQKGDPMSRADISILLYNINH